MMNQCTIYPYLNIMLDLNNRILNRSYTVSFDNELLKKEFFNKEIIKGEYIIRYNGHKFMLNKIQTGIYLSCISSKIIANLKEVYLNYRYKTVIKNNYTIIMIELTTLSSQNQLSVFLKKKNRKPFDINTRPAKMQKYKN